MTRSIVFLATLASCSAVGLPTVDPVLPDVSTAVFRPGAPIDNPYFPIKRDLAATIAAEGVDEDGEEVSERSDYSYAGAGPVIMGVQTTAVLDRAFEDGLLVEETRDYFAQDSEGNVWYFGEDVTNYLYDDEDALIGTNNASAWIAGENDALPGWIMPADPTKGLSYYQEYAAEDEALDRAEVRDILASMTVDGVEYRDVLVIFETTELDPDAREFKYYAPGVGIIRADEGLDRSLSNPELVFERAAR